MLSFLRDEAGQDLVEYALILCFVVLTSAALLTVNQQAINAIWGVTNNNLQCGIASATGS